MRQAGVLHGQPSRDSVSWRPDRRTRRAGLTSHECLPLPLTTRTASEGQGHFLDFRAFVNDTCLSAVGHCDTAVLCCGTSSA